MENKEDYWNGENRGRLVWAGPNSGGSPHHLYWAEAHKQNGLGKLRVITNLGRCYCFSDWGWWHGKLEVDNPGFRTAFVTGWREYLTLSGQAWICSEARNQQSWQSLTQVLTPLSRWLKWLWAGVLLSYMGFTPQPLPARICWWDKAEFIACLARGECHLTELWQCFVVGELKSLLRILLQSAARRGVGSPFEGDSGQFSSLFSNGPSPLCFR